MKADQLAAAIFEYFTSADQAADNAPYTFNETRENLQFSVDGEIYCNDLAKFILAKVSETPRVAAADDQEERDPGQRGPCPGHKWVYTGTAYGGDDEGYFGEGRCYCEICGADGDA